MVRRAGDADRFTLERCFRASPGSNRRHLALRAIRVVRPLGHRQALQVRPNVGPTDRFNEKSPPVLRPAPLFQHGRAFIREIPGAQSQGFIIRHRKRLAHHHCQRAKVDHHIVFQLRLVRGSDRLHPQLRFRIDDEFRDHLQPHRFRVPIGRKMRLRAEDNIMAEEIVFPNHQHVRWNPIKCVGPENPIRRQELAFDRFLDRANHLTFARGKIGQLNGAHATAQAHAIGADVKHGVRIEIGAEDGLSRPAPRDGATGKNLDEIFARFPDAILEIMQAIFDQGELICGETDLPILIGTAGNTPINREVLSTVDDFGTWIGRHGRHNLRRLRLSRQNAHRAECAEREREREAMTFCLSS